MFTGIVEAVGTVKALRKGAHSAIITVEAPQILDDVHLGDSIAVNGVCLTVRRSPRIPSMRTSCMKHSIARIWVRSMQAAR